MVALKSGPWPYTYIICHFIYLIAKDNHELFGGVEQCMDQIYKYQILEPTTTEYI